MNGAQIAQILALLILLGFSAFFSASETAFTTVNKIRIRHLAEEGNKRAQLTRKLLTQPNRLISTLLVGNNLVNIWATAIATSFFINLFAEKGAGISTLVMTIIVLVFGEITPKTFAARRPEQVTLKVIPSVNIVCLLLSPFSKVLNALTGGIIRIFGGSQPENPLLTEEELRMLVNVGQEEGFIDAGERDMIDSIFEFDDTIVREIMVPRIDIVGININETLEDVSNLVIAGGHSRIPVYEQSIDNIVGVIYAKDLLKPLLRGEPKKTTLAELMRPAYYVPESKRVRDLFEELRKEKVHMAIILDEYGGTAGLITIEDLIEEIVGDIQDEYDQEEESIQLLEDGSYLVDARTTISELNELLDVNLSDEEYETVSGLVFHYLGRLPAAGEELDIELLHIIVDKLDGHRVDKLKIYKIGSVPETKESIWPQNREEVQGE